MTSAVNDTTRADRLDVELPAEIFDAPVNVALLHQVVVAQLAAARQGTAASKNRGQVRGGGAKPYRQKGTGRARQGSTRAPQFTGGGIVHGPTPRAYGQKTPKKMKAAALRGALSDRARGGRVHVVSGVVTGELPSTKAALAALRSIADSRHVLLVVDRDDEVTWKSVRNVQTVHAIAPDQLNTYDVLVSDDVVFTKAAFDRFVAGPAKGRRGMGAATSAELPDVATHQTTGGVPSMVPQPEQGAPETLVEQAAQEATAVATPEKPAAAAEPSAADPTQAPYGEGSHIGLEDGSAPAGFAVKGEARTQRFVAPGSEGYEQATAEVWFATVEDAERAGFTATGDETGASSEESDQ